MFVMQVTSTTVHHPDLESMLSVERGTVLFVPSGTTMLLHSMVHRPGASCHLLAYAATANDNMFVSAQDAARAMFRSVSDMPLAKLRARRSMSSAEETFASFDDLRMLRSV